jgi:hypothetical protein
VFHLTFQFDCKIEIRYHKIEIFVDEEIFGLDIPMNEPVIVQFTQAF